MSVDAFAIPISTSNLVRPPRDAVLAYARMAYDGAPLVTILERRLAEFHEVTHCVAVCSGFWALVLSIRALALPGHSDVLMPSLTYRRMADVVAWTRLRPRFCEVDAATLGCTANSLRSAMAPEVGLLLAVHPIVDQVDAEAIADLAAELERPLLFDSVESVSERVGKRRVGGFGAAECFSLHASKLLNGCEGGYITTRDPALALRLRAMRDGVGVDGMDARLHGLHAAMALAALDDLPAQVRRNEQRYALYRERLSELHGLRLVAFEPDRPTSYKTIVAELTEEWPLSRAETLARLNAAGVLARAYYHPPLHAKPMAYPHVPAQLPQTDRLAERYLLLPCGDHVSHDDIEGVAALLKEIGA